MMTITDLYLPPTFSKSYNERFLHKPEYSDKDVIKEYFFRNFEYTELAQRRAKYRKTDNNYVGQIHDGFFFMEDLEIPIIKTFITRDMLSKDQLKHFSIAWDHSVFEKYVNQGDDTIDAVADMVEAIREASKYGVIFDLITERWTIRLVVS